MTKISLTFYCRRAEIEETGLRLTNNKNRGSSTVWRRLLDNAFTRRRDDAKTDPAFRSARHPNEDAAHEHQEVADDPGNLDFFTRSFGLSKRAFSLLPDPEFLSWSEGHRRAYSVLEYGIMTRAPITVITGDVGAGKTTLLQELLETLSSDTIVGLISNAHGNRGDLLRWALSALDVPQERNATYVETFQKLQNFLIENYAAGRYAVLVIDEAQQLTPEGLEELRMLTNINSKKDELLQLVLIGQPELREVIARPEMTQFAQRIMASYHLGPLNETETLAYIHHRLRTAGGRESQFAPDALPVVFQASGGIPRLINKLCDFAIVYAVTAEKDYIDAEVVKSVIADGLLQGAAAEIAGRNSV